MVPKPKKCYKFTRSLVIRLLPRYNRFGLTIAELLVATGLLATVLVTIMTLFGQLLKNTNKNSLLSAGAFFADSVLEQQIGIAEQRLWTGTASTQAFQNPTVNGEGLLSTADDQLEKRTKYIYQLDATRVDNNSKGQWWRVQVEVRWWSDDMTGDAKRAGSGNLFLKRERMVYIPKQPSP